MHQSNSKMTFPFDIVWSIAQFGPDVWFRLAQVFLCFGRYTLTEKGQKEGHLLYDRLTIKFWEVWWSTPNGKKHGYNYGFNKPVNEATVAKIRSEDIGSLVTDHQLVSLEPYVQGKRHGLGIYWYHEGQKFHHIQWCKNKIVSTVVCWYSSGQVASTVPYRNGQRHGEAIWFHPSGIKRVKGRYVRGKQEGKWKVYEEDGTVIAVSHYKQGRRDGLYRSLKQSGYFYSGWAYGMWKTFDDDGNIIKEVRMMHDRVMPSRKLG